MLRRMAGAGWVPGGSKATVYMYAAAWVRQYRGQDPDPIHSLGPCHSQPCAPLSVATKPKQTRQARALEEGLSQLGGSVKPPLAEAYRPDSLSGAPAHSVPTQLQSTYIHPCGPSPEPPNKQEDSLPRLHGLARTQTLMLDLEGLQWHWAGQVGRNIVPRTCPAERDA